jgi:hypothetical protein
LITHTGLDWTAGGMVLGDGFGTGSDEGDGLGAGADEADGPGCAAAELRAGCGWGGDGDSSAARCAPLPGWGVMLTAARGRGLRGSRDAAGLLLADGRPAAIGDAPGVLPGPFRTSPSTAIPPSTTAVRVTDIAALCIHGLKVI